jgi:hypothetical protein
VFGSNAAMAEPASLCARQRECAFEPRRHAERLPAAGRAGTDDLARPGHDRLAGDAQPGQDVGGHPVGLRQQPEPQVLVADVVVSQVARFLLRDGPDGVGDPVGPAAERSARGKSLLGGLLADAEHSADLRPRATRGARFGDEAVEHLLADATELVDHRHRCLEPIERRR